jgi:hypothetical protein
MGRAGRRAGIFGFAQPSSPPIEFPGNLITGTERDATDATKWSRQNNDAALSIAPGALTASGAQTALRFIGYTDEAAVALADRLAIIPRITAASGNISVTSSVGNTSNAANARIGWKQGCVNANAAAAPRLSASFASGVSGTFTQMLGFNLTTLLAQKWFIVITAGQSNWVGATAVADPALDTPVEGAVVFPGAANSYVGAEFSGGNPLPMLALDPVNNQTLNGSSSAYGGGPAGSFLRELRKVIPADFTLVYVASNYAGQGFKTNGYWNKNSAVKDAYTGFWALARHVWSLAPAGSVMGGMIFCGGESDLGGTENGAASTGNLGEWVSTVTGVPALVNEVRAEPGWNAPKGGGAAHGAVPLVIAEIGMDAGLGNVADMIALQRKLRTGSGDGLAYSRCAYVARPAGAVLNADGTHFEQATHRQRGIDVAQALAGIIYG